MGNFPDKRCGENHNPLMFSKFFSPKNAPFCENMNKTWNRRTDRRWQYNTAHAHCMLDN